MKDIPLQVALHSYQSRSKPHTSQRLVNMYCERAPEEAKNGGMSLLGSAGLRTRTTVGDGPNYGFHLFNDLVYIVSGNDAYTLTEHGSVNHLGSLGTVNGGCILRDNGVEVIINLPSGAAYIATPTTLTQITDPDFEDSSSVEVLDGFAIFSRENSNEFAISDLRDASQYDALDYATAEASPDKIVRVFANRGELFVCGSKGIEPHYNSGSGDFPFIPITGAYMDRGLAAKLAIASDDNTFFWLGDDKIFYRASGYTPERISTHGVERAIEGYATISDAEVFIYTLEGHKFVVLTFPSALATWEYNIATGLWNERESFEKGRWRAANHVKAFGKNLVGDFENGSIYELDVNQYTENGNTIQRIITTPPITAQDKRISFHKVTLQVDGGVGLTSGQGSDPKIVMKYSDDGGHTYRNEKWRSLGAKGKYKARPVWNNMGQSRNRTHMFIVSDPVKFCVSGGAISYSVHAS